MRITYLATMATTMLMLLTCAFTSCTSPPGMVAVGAIRPTVEALAPYTTAGIQADPILTETQKATLLRELERTRAMLLEAENKASGDKSKVGAVSSRASPEPLALACIEPTAGVAIPSYQYATNRNQLSIQDRPGYHKYAWSGPQVSFSRARWSFRGHCTEG